MNGLSPEIMNEIFQLREESQYNLRFISQFRSPPIRSVYNCRESVSYIAPKIWELIPSTIGQINSLRLCLCLCLSLFLSVCLSVCLAACLPVCLSVCLPVCLSSLSLSLCLSLSLDLKKQLRNLSSVIAHAAHAKLAYHKSVSYTVYFEKSKWCFPTV